MKYPLIEPTWGAAEREAVLSVIDSGHLTSGERVREFESTFANYVGSKYAVMVNSGSSANLIAIAVLARFHLIQSGDEAIVPAIAWATTYAPLHQYGLRLRVVDVNIETLNIDVSQLEQALTPRTRLLVGVSVLGNPAPLQVLREFADEHGLIFLEDNCESMGAHLSGKQAGTFGLMGTFSTFFSHHVNTVEGGMLVTDDPLIYEAACGLREHGWSRSSIPDGGFYNFLVPGYNVRSTEIAAAVGLVQLERLPAQLAARRANVEKFHRLFANDNSFILQREHGSSSWFCFTMIARGGRERYISAMLEAGIEHRMITGGCFTLHPAAQHYQYEAVGDLRNAELAHRNGFFVGNFGRDLTAEIEYLREVLQ